jgi:hypothetical protein
VDLVAVRRCGVDRREDGAHQRREREDQQRRLDGSPIDPREAGPTGRRCQLIPEHRACGRARLL